MCIQITSSAETLQEETKLVINICQGKNYTSLLDSSKRPGFPPRI